MASSLVFLLFFLSLSLFSSHSLLLLFYSPTLLLSYSLIYFIPIFGDCVNTYTHTRICLLQAYPTCLVYCILGAALSDNPTYLNSTISVYRVYHLPSSSITLQGIYQLSPTIHNGSSSLKFPACSSSALAAPRYHPPLRSPGPAHYRRPLGATGQRFRPNLSVLQPHHC